MKKIRAEALTPPTMCARVETDSASKRSGGVCTMGSPARHPGGSISDGDVALPGAMRQPPASRMAEFTGNLQQIYGNRHVQRVVASAARDKGMVNRNERQQAMGPGHISARVSPAHILRQGLLTPAQEAAAITFSRARFDRRSVMIIQDLTGTTVDGAFGVNSAEAVARFQDAQGLPVDGMAGENTLQPMVLNRVATGLHEHAIQLVADFFNLDVRTGTLSVTFDAALAVAGATNFESGNLRVIRLGPLAFAGAIDLRNAIRNALAVPAPAVAPPGPRPSHLTSGAESAAISFNRARYGDARSVRAIQGLVGANPDGAFGRDTVERIAEFQNAHGLVLDGKAGVDTLREMVRQFDAAGQQNAAIRTIMDFFDLSEHGALLDISFDPTVAANAETSGVIPGPSMVRIGPAGFAQGFEGLVHTIAHELEHVRQRREGIPNRDVREFLGEAVEIISRGMPAEDLAGFMDDAGRALFHWNRIPVAEQRVHWARFAQVRQRVRQRFNAAAVADQATHQATMDGYNAVVRPPP